MMRKIIFCFVFCLLILEQTGSAYDKKRMHTAINRAALLNSNSNDNLENYGLMNGIYTYLDGESISKIIEKGGEKEDNPEIPRTFKHFHDPTQYWDKTTDDAKLSWTPGSMSSVRWAQNQGLFSLGGDWDWEKARKSFYKGLTSINESKREKYLAEAFEALGHIMHLIADMASPPHVRNDPHPLPMGDKPGGFSQIGKWTYETFCKYNVDSIPFTGAASVPTSIFQTSLITGMAPITNLWDTTTGDNPAIGSGSPDIGLAEYTNYNFFSKDTIFDPDYTYPAIPSSQWQIKQNSIGEKTAYYYGSTSDGIPVEHYAKIDYLFPELITTADSYKKSLDNDCFREYASILVPKAVRYSASLLDYFFRGKMDAKPVSLLPDANGDIGGVEVRVQNISEIDSIGEDMSGELEVISRYKLTATDQDFTYGDSTSKVSVSIPYNNDPNNYQYTFNFSNPIPGAAEVVEYTLVFKGTLGNETNDAVAAATFALMPYNSIIVHVLNDGIYKAKSNYDTDENGTICYYVDDNGFNSSEYYGDGNNNYFWIDQPKRTEIYVEFSSSSSSSLLNCSGCYQRASYDSDSYQRYVIQLPNNQIVNPYEVIDSLALTERRDNIGNIQSLDDICSCAPDWSEWVTSTRRAGNRLSLEFERKTKEELKNKFYISDSSLIFGTEITPIKQGSVSNYWSWPEACGTGCPIIASEKVFFKTYVLEMSIYDYNAQDFYLETRNYSYEEMCGFYGCSTPVPILYEFPGSIYIQGNRENIENEEVFYIDLYEFDTCYLGDYSDCDTAWWEREFGWDLSLDWGSCPRYP